MAHEACLAAGDVAESAGHLVWIDCEMTGLDLVKDKLIEVAVIVTGWPNTEVVGLPAWRPEGDEPWIYDGRIRLELRPRSRRSP